MKFVRQIMVVAMIALVSVGGAFGQRGGGGDKRPPKDPAKVIDKKDKGRPPADSNRPKPRDDKKKPFFDEE